MKWIMKKKLEKIEICKRGILVCNDDTENNGETQYMADAMQMINTSEKIRGDIINHEKNQLHYGRI